MIAGADQTKGRFRAFLRTNCQHFLIDPYRRRIARQGRVAPLSIDGHGAEDRYRFEPAETLSPDCLFDRAWASTLLDRVLDLLARECAAKDRSNLDRASSCKIPSAAAYRVWGSGTTNCARYSDGRTRTLLELRLRSARQRSAGPLPSLPAPTGP